VKTWWADDDAQHMAMKVASTRRPILIFLSQKGGLVSVAIMMNVSARDNTSNVPESRKYGQTRASHRKWDTFKVSGIH